jgi:hypothetical protein
VGDSEDGTIGLLDRSSQVVGAAGRPLVQLGDAFAVPAGQGGVRRALFAPGQVFGWVGLGGVADDDARGAPFRQEWGRVDDGGCR